jgi:alpha-D-ribose 1-methylphosphonate 5-phosphate C-P lyase
LTHEKIKYMDFGAGRERGVRAFPPWTFRTKLKLKRG